MSLEEWLRYGPQESLAYFLFQSPQKAKRLYFDIIPKSVDEYIMCLEKFPGQSEEEKLANPVWHIHNGNPPSPESTISFSLLLNLINACGTAEEQVLWGFISRYQKNATPTTMMQKMINCAINYYEDFVKPNKKYKTPDAQEKQAILRFRDELIKLPPEASSDETQSAVYAIGREFYADNMRAWFQLLYEVLLGATQGPRFGSFVALYGIKETIQLIDNILK